MGRLEERLRRLEEVLVQAPTLEEYLDARNREEVRTFQKLAELLAPYGFDGGHLFGEAERRMLAKDTREKREHDRGAVEQWRRTRGAEPTAEVGGAKERLLAKLEARA